MVILINDYFFNHDDILKMVTSTMIISIIMITFLIKLKEFFEK